MIEELKGEIASIDEQFMVIFVGGIGIGVSTTQKLASNSIIGERIHLFTELVLRETDISIYGFVEKKSRNMFRILKKVNGIGPKAALAILSNLSIDQIRDAVRTKDTAKFKHVPGIGTKTAQKIILFLEDVLDLSVEMGFASEKLSINSELLEALVGLGYSVVEAQTCIQKIPDDSPEDLESRLRIALKYFS